MPNENIDNLLIKKPKYKLSASLLNSWIYYTEYESEKTLASFIDRLNNVYPYTPYIKCGRDFENEVVEGKHGQLSLLIAPLKKQVWAENRTIDFGDFEFLISGKLDVWDKEKKRIYDIKRSQTYSKNKFDTSVQHLLYFYLMPEAEEFYYLMGIGKGLSNDPSNLTYPIIRKARPENLDDIILKIINDFMAFLKEKDLWELYTKNYKAKR